MIGVRSRTLRFRKSAKCEDQDDLTAQLLHLVKEPSGGLTGVQWEMRNPCLHECSLKRSLLGGGVSLFQKPEIQGAVSIQDIDLPVRRENLEILLLSPLNVLLNPPLDDFYDESLASRRGAEVAGSLFAPRTGVA